MKFDRATRSQNADSSPDQAGGERADAGLVPAALCFGEQFAVFQMAIQCFGAKATHCSKDSSHVFNDCTHDFLSFRGMHLRDNPNYRDFSEECNRRRAKYVQCSNTF
jgi:hypothetical protein